MDDFSSITLNFKQLISQLLYVQYSLMVLQLLPLDTTTKHHQMPLVGSSYDNYKVPYICVCVCVSHVHTFDCTVYGAICGTSAVLISMVIVMVCVGVYIRCKH